VCVSMTTCACSCACAHKYANKCSCMLCCSMLRLHYVILALCCICMMLHVMIIFVYNCYAYEHKCVFIMFMVEFPAKCMFYVDVELGLRL